MYLIENNFMRTVRISKISEESRLVKTFFFVDQACAEGKPGQFLMVWIPNFNEVPMSISSTQTDGLTSITVSNVGEATNRLHQKKEGDLIGIRGPFGNSFKLADGKALLIGGGTGIAPLAFLAEKSLDFNPKLTFLMGAKTTDELFFLTKMKKGLSKINAKVSVSTEDGSCGYKGVVTELAKETLNKEKFDIIYACGKESMLLEVFRLAEKHRTPLEASLERFMRCAIGLCGCCIIGKYRVCVDGPVFTKEQLREVKDEFGRFKRDFSGRKIPT